MQNRFRKRGPTARRRQLLTRFGTSSGSARPTICAAGSHDILSTLRTSWKFGSAKMLSPDQFPEFAKASIAPQNGAAAPRLDVPPVDSFEAYGARRPDDASEREQEATSGPE